MATDLLQQKIAQIEQQLTQLKLQRHVEHLNLLCVPVKPAEDADDLTKAVYTRLANGAVEASIKYSTLNHQIAVLQPIYDKLIEEQETNKRTAQDLAVQQDAADNASMVQAATRQANASAV